MVLGKTEEAKYAFVLDWMLSKSKGWSMPEYPNSCLDEEKTRKRLKLDW